MFKPFSNEPIQSVGEEFITIDKNSRLVLSAEIRRKFPPTEDGKLELWVALDTDTWTLAVTRENPDPRADIKPYKFDTKGIANARNLVKHYKLDTSHSHRFMFTNVHNVNDHAWHVFQIESAVNAETAAANE